MQPNPWCPFLPSHRLATKPIPRQGFSAAGEKHRVRLLGEASQAPCRNTALYFDYRFPRRTLRKAFSWRTRWKYLTRIGELTSGAGMAGSSSTDAMASSSAGSSAAPSHTPIHPTLLPLLGPGSTGNSQFRAAVFWSYL